MPTGTPTVICPGFGPPVVKPDGYPPIMTTLADAPSAVSPKSRSRILAFIEITKPRIIELLLVTTVPTMIVAARGWPGTLLVLNTLIGGTLAAGGAHAINMVVDRDIDALMERTRNRPLVTGEISPREAMIFALTLEVVAFSWLWFTTNLLSAVLAISATLFYVFVYTLWLKRTSSRNIVIGGAAGAVPVLVGWSAVTNSLSWAPIVLFGIIFYWTPPHFWALAVKYKDDYANASVPMLPAVTDLKTVGMRIIGYTALTWVLTIVFGVVASMGLLYMTAAVVLGAVFMWFAVRVWQTGSAKVAMSLFGWSITYVTLLFGAMALDQLL